MTQDKAEDMAKRWRELMEQADMEEKMGFKRLAEQLRNEALEIDIDLAKHHARSKRQKAKP